MDRGTDDRIDEQLTPGVPSAENVVFVLIGVLCALAVIVHVVLLFT